MKINFILDEGAYAPSKAHFDDAGFDLRTPVDSYVNPNSYVIIDTGIHVEIPHGYVGMIKSKSGLNVNHNLVGEGVIDAGYTGSIVVKLYNNSVIPYEFKAGDKITQLVILPIPDVEMVQVDSFESKSERADGGFGSTGR